MTELEFVEHDSDIFSHHGHRTPDRDVLWIQRTPSWRQLKFIIVGGGVEITANVWDNFKFGAFTNVWLVPLVSQEWGGPYIGPEQFRYWRFFKMWSVTCRTRRSGAFHWKEQENIVFTWYWLVRHDDRFDYGWKWMRPARAQWMRAAPRVPENRLHRIGAATPRLQVALPFSSRMCFSSWFDVLLSVIYSVLLQTSPTEQATPSFVGSWLLRSRPEGQATNICWMDFSECVNVKC